MQHFASTPLPGTGDTQARAAATVIKARAVVATLLALLAVNGVLPLLGHSPAGVWAPAEAAVVKTIAPVKAAPGK